MERPVNHQLLLDGGIPMPLLPEENERYIVNNGTLIGNITNDDSTSFNQLRRRFNELRTIQEQNLTQEQRTELVQLTYQQADCKETNKDALATIARIVKETIIRKHKFIPGENSDGLSEKKKKT
jgi:hypothetical protein